MFANKHFLEDMDFTQSRPGTVTLEQRSVNIYSDMGETVREGDLITITGELIGFHGQQVDLQWQVDDGFFWEDVPGATGLTYSFIATSQSINYSWRLSVTVRD